MKQKPAEQLELEQNLLESKAQIGEKLKDSPISLRIHSEYLRGYYIGFCEGRGWEADVAVMKQLDSI